jgi:hypothetical protein
MFTQQEKERLLAEIDQQIEDADLNADEIADIDSLWSITIPVTSEMVQAGGDAMRSLEYDLWETSSLDRQKKLLTAIYRAMAKVAI